MDLPQPLLSLIDYYKVELALWVGLSIGLYALGVDMAWHYRRPRPGRMGRWVGVVKGWPYGHWLLEAIRLLYYIGIPYAALLRGVALPRLMGLTNLDWFRGIGFGTVLGGGNLLLLALIWWWYARAVAALPPSARERAGTRLEFAGSTNKWTFLREAIYLESHWAFYRSATILLLDDYYAGIFLGFLLVTLEWAMNPAWRKDWGFSWRSTDILMRWSMAFTMAIIFFFIRNLWVLVPIHWGIEMACRSLMAALRKQLAIGTQARTAGWQDQKIE